MKKNDLPVMILAGGFGTRLREETELKPKPMVAIGGKPILWHIMKYYSHYGFYRFIICLGYKANVIKDYFLNYKLQGTDITVNTKTGVVCEHTANSEDWDVTLVDTGNDCQTGGRLARALKYVDTDELLVTYGDGVSDVNLEELLNFHRSHGKRATLTGAKMPFRFGNLKIEDNKIVSFMEKKCIEDQWINGGFFVLNRKFFGYLSEDSNCILEQEPLKNAAQDGELMVYKHMGFWSCMDTLKDHQHLNDLWEKGAPWKVWQDSPIFNSAQVSSWNESEVLKNSKKESLV